MPELPDITVYVDVMRPRLIGARLARVSIRSAFLVRSVSPGVEEFEGLTARSVERLGKRVVIGFDGGGFLVLHLMIAGRLHWKPAGTRARGRIDQAAFEFEGAEHSGVLLLTEAGTKHRAMLHAVRDAAELARHDPGGIDPLGCTPQQFAAALTRENHTVKRTLTDPRVFSGIGNAYSDEILHAAKMSPLKLTGAMQREEAEGLACATRETLEKWTAVLRRKFGVDPARLGPDGMPGKFPGAGDITAFRPDFAVHGKYGQPCPVCGMGVQRIVYAENETNYCAVCQTGGRLLADRSMSRLLKDDWPRTVEEWERA